MNEFPSKEKVEQIKENYPVGTRIELIELNDPYANIETGTQGTVKFVDGVGTLHMEWDNGRTLGIILDEDKFKVLSRPQETEEKPVQSMGGMSI